MQDATLGVFLHTLADSYSHLGFSGFNSEQNDRGLNAFPEIGHGEYPGGVHHADLPFERPALAAEAALAVEDAIREYEAYRTGLPQVHIADRAELKRFYIRTFSRFQYSSGSRRAKLWHGLLMDLGVPAPEYRSGMLDGEWPIEFERKFKWAIESQRYSVWSYDDAESKRP
jgi:hypothetical protein